MSTPVVSDRLRYGLKPIAVESKQSVLVIPALGTNVYEGSTSSTIVFRIPHNPSGRYVDPAATRIKFTFEFDASEMTEDLGIADSFYFERGPESLIRRFTIRDIQQRVLEDIDHYNALYAVTELCTGNEHVRKYRGHFHMEGNESAESIGAFIRHPVYAPLQYQMRYQQRVGGTIGKKIAFDVMFTPLSAVFGGGSEKYIPLSVMEGMEICLQLEDFANAIKYTFAQDLMGGVRKESFKAPPAANSPIPLTRNQRAIDQYPGGSRGGPTRDELMAAIEVTMSRVAEWNYDMKAMILPLAHASKLKYRIKNPSIYISALDVEPNVNAALVRAAKDPRDGMIRIQTHSWLTMTQPIQPNQGGTWSWNIPVSVTSMKSMFFTFTDVTNFNNVNKFKTAFEPRGLIKYRILVGGLPINSEYTYIDCPFVDAYSSLMQAWSVNHKTDANAGLIKLRRYNPIAFDQYGLWSKPTDVIFGQELESFNQKSGLIQSGVNTMQTTFVLECTFENGIEKVKQAPVGYDPLDDDNEGLYNFGELATEELPSYTDNMYEVRAYFMYDKIIAMDETIGSIRAEY